MDDLPPMADNKKLLIEQYLRQKEAFDTILKDKAKTDLFVFNRYVLDVEKGKQELAPFHKELCTFITDDIKKKKLILIPRGHLKALKTEGTLVLTPGGYKKYSDLKVGDKVIGGDGLPTKVIKIHPKSKMELYKVTTNDGRELICNKEHLFRVRVPQNNKRWEIRNLRWILKRYSRERLDKRDGKIHYEHPIQLEPILVEFNEKVLPIDPYTLGMWLGDGHSAGSRMTSDDPEIFNYSKFDWYKLSGKYAYGTRGLQKILRLNDLQNNKHIPREYFTSNSKQRLELLRGLMDTDGTCHSQGGIAYFSNTKYQLIKDIVELVRSLGGVAMICKVDMEVNGKPYDTWTVSVKLPSGINPFNLKRKVKKYTGLKRELTINIVNVEPVDYDVANCITVEGDGMFIVNDYFPTHNSTLVTIGYSLFRIVNNPNVRILILNATWQMAVDFLTEIKNHLQNNPLIAELYPEIHEAAMNPSEWAQDRITIKRNDTNVKGPTVWAAGVESNLVGSHPDVIIMDDVVNRDNVTTPEQIQKVILRYKDCLDLLEPGGQFLVIGTRWSEGDLYAWMLDKDNSIVQSYDVMIKRAYEGDLETGEDFIPLWPAKFSQKELLTRLREKYWYEFSCTPAETPILMSDWTMKSISKIKAGDEVMGFVKENGERSKLCKTKVKRTFSKTDVVYDLKMQSGRKVRCTKDHKWYMQRFDKTHQTYSPAKVGRSLRFIAPTDNFKVSSRERELWMYLAGIFDGEGSAKSGGCLTVTQGHIGNKVVYEKIISTLKKLKIEYSEYERAADNSGGRNAQANRIIWFKNNFETCLKLIRITNLAKKQQIVDKMIGFGKRFVRELDEIEDIKESGIEPVYALETETGNYIAWGYASSNSQYLNNPIPDKAATFQREWFQKFDIEDIRGKTLTKVMTIDPAISLEKEADYTAIIVCGIDTFGNIFVLDMFRDRVSPSQLIAKIFDLNEMWHPNSIGVETVSYQKALSYSLKEEMQKRRKYLPIHELKPQERAKDMRIRGLQPQYAAKKIYHRAGHPITQYLEAELTAFPRGIHDDLVDSFSYALDLLFPPKINRGYQNHYLY